MNETDIKEKIEFFLENKVKVHIELLDSTFLNGTFIKQSRDTVWLINEVKLGEVFVFIKDISVLEQFRGKRWKEEEKWNARFVIINCKKEKMDWFVKIGNVDYTGSIVDGFIFKDVIFVKEFYLQKKD